MYVKIVNALHELIPDEGKYKEAKRRLTEAAFYVEYQNNYCYEHKDDILEI